jgi:excisionase family DNA binding protein
MIEDRGEKMEEMFTMEQVAKLLQVSRNTPYRWSAEGKLPVQKTVTGIVRVKRSDLEKFIAGGSSQKEAIGNN